MKRDLLTLMGIFAIIHMKLTVNRNIVLFRQRQVNIDFCTGSHADRIEKRDQSETGERESYGSAEERYRSIGNTD